MQPTEIQQALVDLGFLWPTGPNQHLVDGVLGPHTAQAVRGFQAAWAGPGELAIDGLSGPQTQASLGWAHANGGALSSHFSASEVWCPHCHKNFARRELLHGLDRVRDAMGCPLTLLDVCRCAVHNAAVGGAADSMHLYGAAADPKNQPSLGQVAGVNAFSGIGSSNATTARHLDVRHVMGALNHTPGATPASPEHFAN